MVDEPPLLLLDACCVINLLASGATEEIVGVLPFRFAVADRVLKAEVLHLREQDDEQGTDSIRTVTLDPLVDQGLLEVLSPETRAETELFVSLALNLDDGEALTAALAIERKGILATDDRKAIRVLRELAPSLSIRRTSSIIRSWAERTGAPSDRLRQMLTDIEQKASFIPPRDDPDREWWQGCLE